MGTSFIRTARTLAFLGLASSAACSDPVDLAEPLLPDLILFQGQPTGSGLGDDVYTMAPDGSDLVRLTTFGDVFAPTWSPDGKQIAFARLGSNHNIFVMDADGSNIRQVTTGPEGKLQQAWAPDGRSLIYLQMGDVSFHTISVDGGADEVLPPCECQVPTCVCQWPTYSPDGSSIAYVSWVPEGTDPHILVPSVFLMGADGSGAVNLLPHGMWGHRPQWLMDGSGILFLGHNGSGLAYDVYRVDADGTDLQRLTMSGSIASASLSRDGTRLIVERQVLPAVRSVLEMMWLDGTAPRQITDLAARNPRWRP